ncbi:MAG: glycosyltransferase [Nitrospirae bacterium]|nr:MAG: glycosyltransferase [Nitrospirota bacterium]
MKISIITCTKNSSLYLEKCIASICSQNYNDFELIFVDGNSTDATLEIIEKVDRPKQIAYGVTGGIASAMNRGVELARGDIIAHLHSDDYYVHDNVFADVAGIFLRSEAQWLFGRCLSDIDGALVPEQYRVPRYSYKRLLKGNFIPHPATFIRRELFRRAGMFDTNIKYGMDYDLWLRFGRIAAPVQLDEHLAVFRRHEGSLSTANKTAAFEEDYVIRRKYIKKTFTSFLYHYAHYIVRKRRLLKSL